MHAETSETIVEQHWVTRIEIIEEIQITEQNSETAHQATQQEILELKAAIQQLSEQMEQKDAELKEFLKVFRDTKSEEEEGIAGAKQCHFCNTTCS
jgi:hypothetical protein